MYIAAGEHEERICFLDARLCPRNGGKKIIISLHESYGVSTIFVLPASPEWDFLACGINGSSNDFLLVPVLRTIWTECFIPCRKVMVAVVFWWRQWQEHLRVTSSSALSLSCSIRCWLASAEDWSSTLDMRVSLLESWDSVMISCKVISKMRQRLYQSAGIVGVIL